MISEHKKALPVKVWNCVRIDKCVYADTLMHMLINVIFLPFFCRAGLEFGQYFKNMIFLAAKHFYFKT